MCYGRGFGLSISQVGFRAQFTVLARDEYGNEPATGKKFLRTKIHIISLRPSFCAESNLRVYGTGTGPIGTYPTQAFE